MKKEALKLADYLDNNVEAMYLSEQPNLDKASDMIRKLVAELDRKDRLINTFKKIHENDNKIIDDLCDKQGEPVEHDFMAYESCGVLSAKAWAYDAKPVKLYRHPPQTKPLSDEEIFEIFDVPKWLQKHRSGLKCIEVCRAIEERHGIK